MRLLSFRLHRRKRVFEILRESEKNGLIFVHKEGGFSGLKNLVLFVCSVRPKEHGHIDGEIDDTVFLVDSSFIGKHIAFFNMVILVLQKAVQSAVDGVVLAGFNFQGKDGEIVVDPLEQAYINEIFSSIPRQLAKENGKFMYSCVSKTAKGRTHADAISWLKDYGLIDICHNLSSIDSPLDFFSLDKQFKIYLSDIGLLTSMLDEDTPFNLLHDLLKVGKGPLYENLIAETFHKMQKPFYYFAKSSGLEVDFVAKLFQGIAILEVKARDGNAKSSKEVLHNPNCHVDKLIKLSAQDIGAIDNFITMPYYLARLRIQRLRQGWERKSAQKANDISKGEF